MHKYFGDTFILIVDSLINLNLIFTIGIFAPSELDCDLQLSFFIIREMRSSAGRLEIALLNLGLKK